MTIFKQLISSVAVWQRSTVRGVRGPSGRSTPLP